MDQIKEFRGTYAFLSNFYNAPVTYRGITYRNNEAAFQAQKEPGREQEFKNLDPSEAKRRGRRAKLRKDWEHLKDEVMYEIVKAKFTHPANERLKEKLLATGQAELIEGNTWHDTYWGKDLKTGIGKNKLGKILMNIRFELIDEN